MLNPSVFKVLTPGTTNFEPRSWNFGCFFKDPVWGGHLLAPLGPPWGAFGPPWGAFGQPWGHLWAPLGPPLGAFGLPWGPFGRPWGVLWKPSVSFWRPSRSPGATAAVAMAPFEPLEALESPKRPKKTIPNVGFHILGVVEGGPPRKIDKSCVRD